MYSQAKVLDDKQDALTEVDILIRGAENKRRCAATRIQRRFRSCDRNACKPIVLEDEEQKIETGYRPDSG
jgi:hypothetical protein